MARPNWTEYFANMVRAVSTRGTCDRKRVGCVITTPDNRILTTGYNGSLRGLDHCDDVGHDMLNNHCVRVIHAEQNAVAQAASNGVSLRGSVAYTLMFPCWNCFKLLIQSGVDEIHYLEDYKHSEETKRVITAVTHLKASTSFRGINQIRYQDEGSGASGSGSPVVGEEPVAVRNPWSGPGGGIGGHDPYDFPK